MAYTASSAASGNAVNTLGITVPATAAAGNLALLATTSQSSVNVPPTGWTLYSPGFPTTNTSAAGRSNLYYKTLVSGDIGATVTVGYSASTRVAMGMWCGNNAGIQSVSVFTGALNSTNIDIGSMTPTTTNTTLVCFFNGITNLTTASVAPAITVPGTMSERVDRGTTGSAVRQSFVGIADEELATTAATAFRTATSTIALQTIPFAAILSSAPVGGGTFDTNNKFFAFF